MSGRFSRLEVQQPQQQPEARQQTPANELGVAIRSAADDLHHAEQAVRTGRFEPALQLYTRALRDDRGIVAAWVGQVQMLVELGDHREARLWSDKALELFRNNGDLMAAKSRACLRIGDQDAAQAVSDASLQAPGSSTLRWQARGELMLALRSPRARDCFEKSLAEPGADWFDRVTIARVHLHYRQPAPAAASARQAVEMHPQSSYAWLIDGHCQLALGFRDQARRSYMLASQLPGCESEVRAALTKFDSSSSIAAFFRRVMPRLRR
jgi:tetratricopeptide (TPR) repeat protein